MILACSPNYLLCGYIMYIMQGEYTIHGEKLVLTMWLRLLASLAYYIRYHVDSSKPFPLCYMSLVPLCYKLASLEVQYNLFSTCYTPCAEHF